MRFAASPYLYLFALVPALLALYIYAFWRKRQALAAFIDLALAPRLLPGHSRMRRWLKALCLVGAVACIVFALMQPQWGKQWQDVPRRGRDLFFLLDVSLSMHAKDVLPNRLERAKADMKELVQILQQEGGHRLGLVAFAGRASMLCPLTLDYTFFLQQLDEVGPDSVSRQGTSIGDAIMQTLEGFGELEQKQYTDIILITDGEDHGSLPLEAAQTVALHQVSLYTVGVGSASKGALIPMPDTEEGDNSFVEYQGLAVLSRMQQSLLLEMARLTGGAYMPASTRSSEMNRLHRLYKEKIAPKERRNIDVAARERFVHRYHWFVLGAVILLAIDMMVRERKIENEVGQ